MVYRQGGREITATRAARSDPGRGRAAVAAAPATLRRRGRRRCCSEFGIPVVHALAGVGENLQDHLQARVIFRCTKPITTNDILKSRWRKAAMGVQFVLARTGPMAVGINQGGIFARTDRALARPDVQFHVATLSSDMAGSPVHEFSGFTMSVCQLQPRVARPRAPQVARSARRAGDAAQLPVDAARPRDAGRRDPARADSSPRRARSRPTSPANIGPGPEAATDDDLLEFARNTAATIFHPSGTCKMGPATDPLAVVDAELRVHGIAGLRVVDCSIMPTLVSGNTNAPVVMIAEKAADMILAAAARLTCDNHRFPRIRRSRPCPAVMPISPPSRAATAGSPSACRRSRSAPGVLAEAGDNARELGLKRVALFTDPRLKSGEYVATVKASLAAAGVDVTVYGEVAIEPTDASFQEAARFAAEGRFDGYVSVGGGSVMDTCKAANLYASHPAEFMTYVNAPIGGGQKVPGPVQAAHRLSDDLRHRLGDHRHRDLHAACDQLEDRHHVAPPDPRRRADRSDRRRVRCRRTPSRRPDSTA